MRNVHQAFTYAKFIDSSFIVSTFENVSLSFEILIQCKLWKEVNFRSSCAVTKAKWSRSG